MSRFRRRSWTAVALLAAGLAGGCANQPSLPNELPGTWSLEEIEKAAPPRGGSGQVYVLAWKVEQDEEQHRGESCLALRVLDCDDGEGRWCLGCLQRNPDEERPRWRLPMGHRTYPPGHKYAPGLVIPEYYERFKGRPGNKEVYAFCGSIFKLSAARKLVGCGVCEQNWQAALGEKPTRFFGN